MRRETLVPRFYGSEIEYRFTPNINPKPKYPDVKRANEFLENGSRMYKDCGLIEYATPECPTLEDLITHEIAGEELVWDAYGDGKSNIRTLHKRVVTPDGKKSSGAHENYSTVNLIWGNNSESHKQSLAVHFATRTVFMGAGQPTEHGYFLGQKMQHVKLVQHAQATEKPLVDTKMEPHSGGAELHRLQVSSGDANISPWATRMKFGTTSLLLRLLEHDVDVSDLHLADPLGSAHIVAKEEEGLVSPLLLESAYTATALDLQEIIAERAALLSQRIELPKQEQKLIPEWFKTIDALRRYADTGENQPELRQIDWYAKKELLERDREKKGEITLDREREIDLVYDQVPHGASSRLRQNPSWFAPHMPESESIERAKTDPPEGRAKMRGEAIKEAANRGKALSVQWGYFSYDGVEIKLPIDGDYSDKENAKRMGDVFGGK